MKKLLSYFRPYAFHCVMAPLFKLFEVLLELYVPLVVARMVDSGIRELGNSYVLRQALLLVLFPALGFLCAGTAQYFSAKAAALGTSDIRKAAFRRIQGLSYSGLDRMGVSTLLTRMTSDMNSIQTGVNFTLRLVLRSPFVVFGAMAMAFTIDAKCALIFALGIPVLTAVSFGVMLAGMPRLRAVQQKLDGLTERTRDGMNGVRVIRAMGIEDREVSDFRESAEMLRDAQTASSRLSTVLNPLTLCVTNVCIGFLVWQGALKVQAFGLTQGQVLALYNYMTQVQMELWKMAMLVITLSKANAAGERVAEILTMEPEAAGTVLEGASGAEAVRFSGVSFSYTPDGEAALRDIDFSVEKGRTVGIIGGTGCGKTTLMNLIPAFYLPTAGTVCVDGVPTTEWDRETLRRKVSVVFQKALLFSGTIRDNLLMGAPDADEDRMARALETARATEIVDGKPDGLDSAVEPGGRNFSGGQRQRLTIARALASRPEILILDDSSSALDAATDAALRRSVAELDWKPTVFIVSQRVASVKNADVILVMDEGRICGTGTHRELLESCEEYREIVDSQTEKEVRA